eukprot:TRINITY_DN37307_c0_g1_i1.p1 TRINITY_DN37307_c0_g1~~TRINITY_DN37307_c0_g1_i1.p1  ORF type:complete len:318 (-),score=82.59 TRINITY_DN37307_c0_g1_i1:280-1233(-)
MEAAVPTTPLHARGTRSRAASAADGLLNLAQQASPRDHGVPCSPDALSPVDEGYDLSAATYFPTKEEIISELRKSPSTQSLADLAKSSGIPELNLPHQRPQSRIQPVNSEAVAVPSTPAKPSAAPAVTSLATPAPGTTSATQGVKRGRDNETKAVQAPIKASKKKSAGKNNTAGSAPAAKKAKTLAAPSTRPAAITIDSEPLFASSLKLLTPRPGASSPEDLLLYVSGCLNYGDLKLLRSKTDEARQQYMNAQVTLQSIPVGIKPEVVAELTARLTDSFKEVRKQMEGQETAKPAERYIAAKQDSEVASILAGFAVV